MPDEQTGPKLTKYRVFVKEVHHMPYDVMAESEEDAIECVENRYGSGMREIVEGELEYSHDLDSSCWIVTELDKDEE